MLVCLCVLACSFSFSFECFCVLVELNGVLCLLIWRVLEIIFALKICEPPCVLLVYLLDLG